MTQLPGKSRAELDKDYEELMRKVEEDIKVWNHPPRWAKADFSDGVALGFIICALGYGLIKWLL
jgi:hypothetical protein